MARAFPDRLADRTDWFLSAAASRRYAARRAHYGKSEAAGAFAAQADCRRDDAGDRRHFVDVHHRVFLPSFLTLTLGMPSAVSALAGCMAGIVLLVGSPFAG